MSEETKNSNNNNVEVDLTLSLPVLQSVQELSDFITEQRQKDSPLSLVFAAIVKEKNKEKIEEISSWAKAIKQKLNPENQHEGIIKLKEQILNLEVENGEKNEEQRKLLTQLASLRETIKPQDKEYNKAIGKLDNFLSPVLNALNQASGYSNRGRRAQLMTPNAGKTKIEGAQTDKHGNAYGSEYDLGVDGAFSDFKIMIYQFYGFDMEYAKKAFQKKGFKCELRSTLDSVEVFTELIMRPEVCQLWIISGSSGSFNSSYANAIEAFHRSGKSIFVWGDNVPYYEDANFVLETLFSSDLKMLGNSNGQKTIAECNSFHKDSFTSVFEGVTSPSEITERAKELSSVIDKHNNVGFTPHMVTTGLAHLYEGHTVATFNSLHQCLKLGFLPMIFGSDTRLITIVRHAEPGRGAVIADGAFTRLYVSVDEAGTIRFIINAACWLALESITDSMIEDEDVEEEEEEGAQISPYDLEDCFKGAQCSILFTEAIPSFVSIQELADRDLNTTDYILNDPLSAGDQNVHVLGRYIYGEAASKVVVGLERDPYQRTKIAGMLPAISLSSKKNVNLFVDELCRVFLGRKMPATARLLFVASVDSLLDPSRIHDLENETLQVYQYMFDQCLLHFPCSSEFSEGGVRLPLLEAMKSYFTVAPQNLQISKSFKTVCLIARTLFSKSVLPIDQILPIVRRSYIKMILNAALKFIKDNSSSNNHNNKNNANNNNDDDSNNNNNGDEKKVQKSGSQLYNEMMAGLMYNAWNGIPKYNSGHIMEAFPSFITENYFKAALSRFENLTGVTVTTSALHTLLFYLLTTFNVSSFRIEALLTSLLSKSPLFSSVWNDSVLPTDDQIITLLNDRFVNLNQLDQSHIRAPPFATIHGPSCYFCSCGFAFGDPVVELTDEYIETIKRNRNNHFKDVYSSDINGYPTSTSSHFSLHRAVINVMRSSFPSAVERSPEIISEIGSYLLQLNKGNIYGDDLVDDITSCLDDFLSFRRQIEGELPPLLKSFSDRIHTEQQLLLQKSSSSP